MKPLNTLSSSTVGKTVKTHAVSPPHHLVFLNLINLVFENEGFFAFNPGAWFQVNVK